MGPKLAREIETSFINFDKYTKKCEITQPECSVTINEPQISLKTNKSPGYGENSIHFVGTQFFGLGVSKHFGLGMPKLFSSKILLKNMIEYICFIAFEQ